jgi:phospholipase/carboxylesterase
MNKPKLIETGENLIQAGLVHRVLQPDVAGSLPTVVMLHGRSGNEDVMWVFARTIPQNWLIVAPRAILSDGEGGYSWHPYQPGVWPTLPEYDEGVTAVVHFIHALPHLYNADPNRIYLMGFSQGAALSYATAIHHPGLVQGIAGLVGFVAEESDAALASEPLKELPIFTAVGKTDERIPLERARHSAETLKTAAAALDYHEYDTGHKLNAQGMRDLTQWWANR